MEELKQKYLDHLNGGWNRKKAIENAMRELYPDKHIYIYLDNYEDFSHVFIEHQVLFSDGSIYNKQ